jgi:hypothetical protein
VGQPLTTGTGAAKGTGATSGAGASTGTASRLRQLFDLHKGKYETQTQTDYDRLRKDLAPDQVTASIQSAWASDNKLTSALATLKLDLAAAATQLTKDWSAFADSKKPDEQASRIVDGLNSILFFYKALTKKIASDITDVDMQKAARSDLDQVIGQNLNGMIVARQAAVNGYGTAITFIGEVAK